MESFFSRLENRVRETNSLLCVGLDPHLEDIPLPSADAARDFCLRLVDLTSSSAAAFKPNAAFFEQFGAAGWDALADVIAAAKSTGALLLLDAKRGDIASTARAYARAIFDTLDADAVTLSPYLGYDSIEPFLEDPQKGVFLLCKTSNPGSDDIQNLLVRGRGGEYPLYEEVARLAQQWNTRGNVGLVVGATQPEALARVRAAAPNLWFLAPGVGAQGADLQTALNAGLREDGMGMLISVSRGISRAEDPARAAETIREEIRAGIAARTPNFTAHALLPERLLSLGCVRFGEFTLKSGKKSPIYIDLRRLVASPRTMSLVAKAYAEILRTLDFDLLAALPYAALPIGAAVSLEGGWPLIYPRKETKSYGTKASIEGVYRAGQRAVVLDDLITTGESKLEGIAKLTDAGLSVEDIVVLIDRQSGGSNFMAEHGYRLHSVFTLPELLDIWETSGAVSRKDIAAARIFLES
jgi:uridine monophosphate synthetase